MPKEFKQFGAKIYVQFNEGDVLHHINGNDIIKITRVQAIGYTYFHLNENHVNRFKSPYKLHHHQYIEDRYFKVINYINIWNELNG